MRIVRLKNVNEVAEEVHKSMRRLALAVTGAEGLRAFLPAGSSPRALYHLMQTDIGFWQTRLSPIQIDEFRDPRRPFFQQLNSELIQPLGIKSSRLWNINSSPLEIEEHVATTLSQPIHLALLGLGPNGHVGFHEPGLPADFRGGEVKVSEETRLRVPGIATNLALTFGASAFAQAQEIIMIVCGEEKRDILKRLEISSPNLDLPASLLKIHPRFSLFTDLS